MSGVQQKPFAAYRGTDPFFFVCYAHEDAVRVYAELERLGSMGANLWYDEGITPGSEWSEELANAIRNSSGFLLFVSTRSIHSKHCRDEIAYAQDKQIPIVCIFLEATELTEGLKLSLSANQAILKHEISDALYEEKLQGLIKPKEVHPVASHTPPIPTTPKKRRYALLTLLALTAIVLVATGIHFTTRWAAPDSQVAGASLGKKALAVLPFVNLSNNPDNEFFADGLTDTLIHRLSQLSVLQVTARTSAFAFKHSNEPINAIADKLRVGIVLDGSVQRFGEQIRVFAKLTDVVTNENIWSQQFDMDAVDIFLIHDEIATSVTKALQLKLLGQAVDDLTQHQTENLEAYEAYLLGLQLLDQLDFTAMEKSASYFQRAIKLDPAFAMAYVNLSHNYITQYISGRFPLSVVRERALPLLDSAFELDPRLPEAFAMRGLVTALSGDNAGGRIDLEKAIELNASSAISHSHLGGVLAFTSDPQRAMELTRKARSLDPMGAWPKFDFLFASQRAGEFEQAWSVIESGNQSWDLFFQGLYHTQVNGRYDLAFQAYRNGMQVDPLDPEYAAYLSMNFVDLGREKDAREYLAEALAINSQHSLVALSAVIVELEFGTIQRARDIARAAIDSGWPTRFGSVSIFARVLRDEFLQAGDPEGALALYNRLFPRVRDLDLEGTWPVVFPAALTHAAIDKSVILETLGRTTEAEALLGAADQMITTSPRLGLFGYGLADVEILALRGERDAALSKLTTALNGPWLQMWRFHIIHNQNLASLQGDPQYQALLAQLEARVLGSSGL